VKIPEGKKSLVIKLKISDFPFLLLSILGKLEKFKEMLINGEIPLSHMDFWSDTVYSCKRKKHDDLYVFKNEFLTERRKKFKKTFQKLDKYFNRIGDKLHCKKCRYKNLKYVNLRTDYFTKIVKHLWHCHGVELHCPLSECEDSMSPLAAYDCKGWAHPVHFGSKYRSIPTDVHASRLKVLAKHFSAILGNVRKLN
jgi:hypothetical protein